ncbi:MAG: FAD-dependent oxidoreductase [Gemmatimonadota bacterium]|jgi:thioredoxin reductase (NADPH)
MKNPIILAVDDEPEVLNAVVRDLRRHYGQDYRVLKASSGEEALETVRELKRRGLPLALLVVDQRMPGLDGTEFMVEALKIYPSCRRVLLTAYADTDAAIAAINDVGLDHYLLKPWQPPEERLYPVLDDLLFDWAARARPESSGLRVAGTRLSSVCYRLREFLSGNQVPYQWMDVEDSAEVREMVAAVAGDPPRLPVVFLEDGTALVQPDPRELAERIGMQTRPREPFYDLVIVGGGPAGLAGAVYAASEGLRVVLVERAALGGQAGTSSRIENYLGFPSGLTGADLANRASAQARRFGAELLMTQEVVELTREDPYRIVRLSDGSELRCYAVLFTPGMEVRPLEAPGVEEHLGAGVYYGAALTEAAAYRDRDVFVVGGANSAGQGAMFFSRTARSVTLLVRGEGLHAMSQYLVDRIEEAPNVHVRTGTELVGVQGDGRVQQVVLREVGSDASQAVPADALFIFIGARPRTEAVAGVVERDEDGFILTGRDVMVDGRRPRGWTEDRDPLPYETSVPGVFAAGDVRHGSGKRVASAVGEGSATIGLVHQYLRTV